MTCAEPTQPPQDLDPLAIHRLESQDLGAKEGDGLQGVLNGICQACLGKVGLVQRMRLEGGKGERAEPDRIDELKVIE